MLNRIETQITKYLFDRCFGRRTVLINPDEIITAIGTREKDGFQISKPKYEITKKQLEIHMKNIVLDGYVDFSSTTDKAGNNIYVVTLTTQGEAFKRQHEEKVKLRIQSIAWKIFLTTIGVLFGITLTKLLGG